MYQIIIIISYFTNEPINIALKDIDEQKDLSDDHIILWAHRSLRRLQLFYAIPTSDMSEGRINEKVIGDRMDGNGYISRFQPIVFNIFTN